MGLIPVEEAATSCLLHVADKLNIEKFKKNHMDIFQLKKHILLVRNSKYIKCLSFCLLHCKMGYS